MKVFLHQACVLGGIYFIISEILGFIPSSAASWIGWFFVFVLAVLLIVLAFRKSLVFVEKFINKYFKISNYIAALGVATYFGFFFGFIPGAIDGYLASRASFENKMYVSQFVDYLPMFVVLYWVVFFAALILATYLSFIKPWIYKEDKK